MTRDIEAQQKANRVKKRKLRALREANRKLRDDVSFLRTCLHMTESHP